MGPGPQTQPARDGPGPNFPGPPPGFGPPGFGERGGAVMQALADLQAAAADPKTSPKLLKEKVAAVRSSRQKAKAELEAAQKDLLKLLTPDQEAMLIGLGYLD